MDLANYQGVYSMVFIDPVTYLTPLIVYDDGTVDIGGVDVPVSFDGAQTLIILACNVGGYSILNGSLQFSRSAVRSGWTLSGNLYVQGLGNVPYSGFSDFVFQNPTLQNAVDANASLDSGDLFRLRGANGDWVAMVAQNELSASATTVPPFAYGATAVEGGFVFYYDSDYWMEDQNNVLAASGTLEQAMVFNVRMTLSGKALLQSAKDGSYVYVRPDGLLGLADESTLAIMTEFDLWVQPVDRAQLLARWGVEELAISACTLDIASLCWQVTGGLFLALGLGPYIAESADEVKIGVMGILRTSPAVWSKVTAAIDFLKANPKASASVIAGLATGILGAAWSAGLLWKLVKYVLQLAGWWILFRLLAHIIEVIFLPEVEIAQLIASFIVWAAQLINLAVKISQDCKSSVALPAPPPRWHLAPVV